MTATLIPPIKSGKPTFALGRPPQTPDELWWAIYAMWGVKVPRVKVCRNHVAPFTALYRAYFAMDPMAIWWASRGYGGKSYLLSTLVSSEAAFMGAQCSLLGGSGAQSLNVHNHTKELWSHYMAPRGLLVNDNKFDTVLSNKGHIRSLMASQGSVRGPHPQRLRMDEIDEMEQEILDAALGQPMEKRGIATQVVMSSTWQYPDGTMTHMLKQAEENNWPVYSWCYRETSNDQDGWLTEREIAIQKTRIPRAMWDAEYELQEPSFKNRAIDQDLVEAAFSMQWGVWSGEAPVIIEERMEGVKYVTGADWARRQDRCVVATFRLPDFVCVAWQAYNRLPWAVQVRRAFDQWSYFGGTLVHDATGIGDVVDDALKDLTTSRYEMRNIKGLSLNRGNLNAMLTDYVNGIEQGAITYPRIELAFDEHRYASIDDLYTSKGHTPDSFIAGALAYSERNQRIGKLAAATSTRKTSGWSTA